MMRLALGSLLFLSGGAFAFSASEGSFDASGTQTGGTSYNFSSDSGLVIGSSSSKRSATGYPSSTYKQFIFGSFGNNAGANFSANADGSANGFSQSNSNSTLITDTTSTLAGTLKMANGTAVYDNSDHSHDSYNDNSNINLWQWSGQVYGNAMMHAHDNLNWDYNLSVNVDLDNDLLHAQMPGGGSGATGTDDTGGQTFVFWQNGNTSSSIDAWGVSPLTNNDGYNSIGGWDFTAKASGNTNDHVTVWMTLAPAGWQETGRQFSIFETSTKQSKYQEHDWTWLDAADSLAGGGQALSSTFSHHQTVNTFSNVSTVQDGTNQDSSFFKNNTSYQNRHDWSNSVWFNASTGEARQSSSDSTSVQSSAEVRAGTEVNNQSFLTVRYTNDVSSVNTKLDGWSSAPQMSNVWHQRQKNEYHYWLDGDSAEGTGGRTTYIRSAMWGSQTNRSGTTSWGNPDPKPQVDRTEDMSWPNSTATSTWNELVADFQRDPYAGSTLRIGFGVIDVIAGAVMTLGTCGGAVVPGLGLMIIGVDQIASGINNLNNPGSPSMSVIEFGGYSAAKGLGASENTSQMVGAYTPAALSLAFNVWGGLAACFAAGTPLLTPDGDKPIEQFKPGDWVLSAPECDPEAPPEPRQVEEVFVNLMPLLELQVGGQTIRTTSEHPFYVRGKGWTAAKELQAGNLLRSHDGQWVAVELVTEGEGLAPVYNLRVAEHHTYFVGSREWGFSVWAHNACVQVTSWADTGVTPDLNPGRWVQLGGPTYSNYLKSGLWGGKAYVLGKFPFLRYTLPTAPFANYITGFMEEARLMWPQGWEFWKGILGQRIIR